jgi:hypothetical protein
MLRIVSVFALVFLFWDCYAQHTKQSVIEHKYELLFYPVGSPQDVRYSITVNKDSIQAENHRPTKRNKNTHYTGKLSLQQKEKLYSLYNSIITKLVVKNDPSVLDTWTVILLIDDEKVYEDDDFSFENSPKDIAKLIKYIVKIGVIKIELYGFS